MPAGSGRRVRVLCAWECRRRVRVGFWCWGRAWRPACLGFARRVCVGKRSVRRRSVLACGRVLWGGWVAELMGRSVFLEGSGLGNVARGRGRAAGRPALRASCFRALSWRWEPRGGSRENLGIDFSAQNFRGTPPAVGGGRAGPSPCGSRAGPWSLLPGKKSQPKAVQAVSGGFGVIRWPRLHLSWSRKRLMCVMISFQSRSIWRSSSLRLALRSGFVMGVTQIFAHRVGSGSGRRYW